LPIGTVVISDLPCQMRNFLKLTLLLLLSVSVPQSNLFAQKSIAEARAANKKQRQEIAKRDSILRAFNKTDTSLNNLLQRLEQYTVTFNEINTDLSNALDTAEINQKLPSTIKRINKIKYQAEAHKSSTLRYLFVLRNNLDQLQDRLKDWQYDLDRIDDRLVQNQTELIKFTKDSIILKTIPTDSVLRALFFEQRKNAILLWLKTDSANRRNLFKVNFLQNRVAIAYSNILNETDRIDNKVDRFAERAFEGEFGYLWVIDPQYKDFKTAFDGTVDLNNTQLYYFIKKETRTHFISILFFTLFICWLIYNREKTKRETEAPELIIEKAGFIFKTPLVSCLLVPLAIIPYFYDHPPVIFLEAFFLLTLLLILVLVRKTLDINLFKALHGLFYITIGYSASNLLIQITNFDRFGIMLLSIAALFVAYKFNKKVSAEPDKYPKNTLPALRLFMGLQLLALFCDVSGRFSLAKIIGITATFNLWFLLSLYFVVEIISQGLSLQFQSQKEDDAVSTWIDYALLLKKFRSILNLLATVLWLFFLLQNLNIDDAALNYIKGILNEAHTVGGASFTFGGFVIFIAVIWLSSIMSRIISYFYDISAQRSTEIESLIKKNRTSTLLIRIGVFTVGFFLAVFASNFPLDKITIIISAFGIGIGFGLQNIVNNLVSGLILAFEKPVQIGDIIEVDNRSGTIKEIGIRASKIETGDGAEVIIPNGDLISHHVVNWTLSNNNRRVELTIGVAYGSNIQKVKTLLMDVVEGRDDIMNFPAPSVFVHNINETSVDFKVAFWAAEIGQWVELKSNILTEIYTTLEREGVKLPSRQQDVQVNLPGGKTLALEEAMRPVDDTKKKIN
jgi:potassium efflux system protein